MPINSNNTDSSQSATDFFDKHDTGSSMLCWNNVETSSVVGNFLQTSMEKNFIVLVAGTVNSINGTAQVMVHKH